MARASPSAMPRRRPAASATASRLASTSAPRASATTARGWPASPGSARSTRSAARRGNQRREDAAGRHGRLGRQCSLMFLYSGPARVESPLQAAPIEPAKRRQLALRTGRRVIRAKGSTSSDVSPDVRRTAAHPPAADGLRAERARPLGLVSAHPRREGGARARHPDAGLLPLRHAGGDDARLPPRRAGDPAPRAQGHGHGRRGGVSPQLHRAGAGAERGHARPRPLSLRADHRHHRGVDERQGQPDRAGAGPADHDPLPCLLELRHGGGGAHRGRLRAAGDRLPDPADPPAAALRRGDDLLRAAADRRRSRAGGRAGAGLCAAAAAPSSPCAWCRSARS